MEKDDAGVESLEQQNASFIPEMTRKESSLAAMSGGQGVFYEEYYDD
jgi:hypothetical protein